MTDAHARTGGRYRTVDAWEQEPFDFDGATYDHERDHARLGAQLRRIVDAMGDMEWWTLGQLAARTGDPEASISARIRDLRKPPHYWLIEREHVRRGQWRYRIAGLHPDRERNPKK